MNWCVRLNDAGPLDDLRSKGFATCEGSLTAEVCARHRVPVRRLRAADLIAGRRGITGHADVSRAFGKSDHWDPGTGFPWQRFVRLVRASDGGGDVVERTAEA